MPVTEWEAMAAQISAHPGQSITIVVERDGARVRLDVPPASDKGQGRVGVSPSKPPTRVSIDVREAAMLSLTKPPQIVKGLVVGLGLLVVLVRRPGGQEPAQVHTLRTGTRG